MNDHPIRFVDSSHHPIQEDRVITLLEQWHKKALAAINGILAKNQNPLYAALGNSDVEIRRGACIIIMGAKSEYPQSHSILNQWCNRQMEREQDELTTLMIKDVLQIGIDLVK